MTKSVSNGWQSLEVEDALNHFIEQGMLNETDTELLREFMDKWRLELCQGILKCHLMTESEWGCAVADMLGWEFLEELEILEGLFIAGINMQEVFDLRILPLESADGQKTFYISDPWHKGLRDWFVREAFDGHKICLAKDSSIARALLSMNPVLAL